MNVIDWIVRFFDMENADTESEKIVDFTPNHFSRVKVSITMRVM